MTRDAYDAIDLYTLALAVAAVAVAVDQAWGIPFSPIWLTLAAVALRPVALRVEAVRALRMVYTWRGVFLWLKGRKRSTGQRGIVAVLRAPAKVTAEAHALAEGAFA